MFGIEVDKEDLNLKFLRSLPLEFHTNVIFWENKPEVETMKLNDLYNNFKIIEQRLKKAGKLNTSSGNLALLSSSVNDSSDEDSDEENSTADLAVSTVSTSVTTVNYKKKVAGLGILPSMLSSQAKLVVHF